MWLSRKTKEGSRGTKDRRFHRRTKVIATNIRHLLYLKIVSKSRAFGIRGSSGEGREDLSLSLSHVLGWFELIINHIVFGKSEIFISHLVESSQSLYWVWIFFASFTSDWGKWNSSWYITHAKLHYWTFLEWSGSWHLHNVMFKSTPEHYLVVFVRCMGPEISQTSIQNYTMFILSASHCTCKFNLINSGKAMSFDYY